MTIDMFEKCISTVPTNICLSFSGFSEPWLNPDCTSMILLAHQKGYKIRANTTLAGMCKVDMERLAAIPFVKFVVHLPDDKKLTKIKVDDQYLQVLDVLLHSGIKNLFWKFHNTTPDIHIIPDVYQLLLKNKARIMYSGINHRAGTVETELPYYVVNKDKILGNCQDFHHNILLPNGDVALCHMDWSLKHILGNLVSTNYNELYKGDSFIKVITGLKNIHSDILCRSCEKDIVSRNIFQSITQSFQRKITGHKRIY